MEQVTSDGSLTEQARQVLRQAITSGELAPGSLHSIHNLAGVLGVSRTPVREALLALERQGMVRFERNRGVRILETSLHDLEEIFSLRLLLEVPATERAARLITAETLDHMSRELSAMEQAASGDDEPLMMSHDRNFHRLLLDASGNRRLTRYVEELRDLIIVRGASTAGRSRTLEDIIAEHRVILDALEERDARGAASLMKEHLINTARLLLSQEAGTDPLDVAFDWA